MENGLTINIIGPCDVHDSYIEIQILMIEHDHLLGSNGWSSNHCRFHFVLAG